MKPKKKVTIEFSIPSDWTVADFILELAGAYVDANEEAANQVDYFVVEGMDNTVIEGME